MRNSGIVLFEEREVFWRPGEETAELVLKNAQGSREGLCLDGRQSGHYRNFRVLSG